MGQRSSHGEEKNRVTDSHVFHPERQQIRNRTNITRHIPIIPDDTRYGLKHVPEAGLYKPLSIFRLRHGLENMLLMPEVRPQPNADCITDNIPHE